ncbi:hypothetical protein [Nocardia pseudobrasiliensis]|uniref:DUF8020 domain-containing protein n=1 Tax=Nocardia pseudobrasiliensis TaxID=45979 RepID=A0A370HWB1_9NOCA|nr:hypothetical protein [Nocardia pseudobrasiliensis]RDI62796.1 hypothetical protein DFR76_112114 [Nocardia pseudobrasiliensis]
MKFTKAALLAAALSTALGVTAGASHAAPQADSDVINYTSTATKESTIVTTDAGSMVVEDGAFKIKAANGATVGGTELSFRVDDFVFPIAAEIKDRTATLTPQFDLRHAVYKPVALPFEDSAPWKTPYDREQAAWSRMTGTISLGASIATLVGGIGGAAVGCILGGAAGIALTGPLSAMLGAPIGAVGGCIAGILAIGALGTLAGQILITAPVAVMAALQYFTTINQPFTPAAPPAK